jgi:adenosylmethionine-8-amino-7-oxononanoate aminotransferase
LQGADRGNTLGALSVSDFTARRSPFEGALVPASFVSCANEYRLPEGVSASDLVNFAARELEQEILRIGPAQVAAFVFEPVVGAAGCVIPPPKGYVKAVHAVCQQHGVLLIADEVMCGAGRTGYWRALEPEGIEADIFAIAKGLAGGYVPLGAAICSNEIAEILEKDGGILTGHTFTGHTLACAAGVAVQRIIDRDGLLARMHNRGTLLLQELRQSLADIESVGDIRGRGYFVGIEFVADRTSREPYPESAQVSQKVARAAADIGLLVYPTGGNVDGVRGDGLIIAPPYNATDTELAELIELASRAIRTTLVT